MKTPEKVARIFDAISIFVAIIILIKVIVSKPECFSFNDGAFTILPITIAKIADIISIKS